MDHFNFEEDGKLTMTQNEVPIEEVDLKTDKKSAEIINIWPSSIEGLYKVSNMTDLELLKHGKSWRLPEISFKPCNSDIG